LTSSFAQAALVDDVLKEYATAGGMNFSANAGTAMWQKDYPDPKRAAMIKSRILKVPSS